MAESWSNLIPTDVKADATAVIDEQGLAVRMAGGQASRAAVGIDRTPRGCGKVAIPARLRSWHWEPNWRAIHVSEKNVLELADLLPILVVEDVDRCRDVEIGATPLEAHPSFAEALDQEDHAHTVNSSRAPSPAEPCPSCT